MHGSAVTKVKAAGAVYDLAKKVDWFGPYQDFHLPLPWLLMIEKPISHAVVALSLVCFNRIIMLIKAGLCARQLCVIMFLFYSRFEHCISSRTYHNHRHHDNNSNTNYLHWIYLDNKLYYNKHQSYKLSSPNHIFRSNNKYNLISIHKYNPDNYSHTDNYIYNSYHN